MVAVPIRSVVAVRHSRYVAEVMVILAEFIDAKETLLIRTSPSCVPALRLADAVLLVFRIVPVFGSALLRVAILVSIKVWIAQTFLVAVSTTPGNAHQRV